MTAYHIESVKNNSVFSKGFSIGNKYCTFGGEKLDVGA